MGETRTMLRVADASQKRAGHSEHSQHSIHGIPKWTGHERQSSARGSAWQADRILQSRLHSYRNVRSSWREQLCVERATRARRIRMARAWGTGADDPAEPPGAVLAASSRSS